MFANIGPWVLKKKLIFKTLIWLQTASMVKELKMFKSRKRKEKANKYYKNFQVYLPKNVI
jgi:hypothetical protein